MKNDCEETNLRNLTAGMVLQSEADLAETLVRMISEIGMIMIGRKSI